MIILVSVVAQIGPKGSCAVHMNRTQPATSVGYSIYLKKNYPARQKANVEGINNKTVLI